MHFLKWLRLAAGDDDDDDDYDDGCPDPDDRNWIMESWSCDQYFAF